MFKKHKYNQLQKGIMRSVISLPCFVDIEKSQRVAGQRSQQGTKFCRMGRNSVCLNIHLFIRCPSKDFEGQLEGSDSQLMESEGLPEGSEGLPEGSEGQP